MNKLAVYDNATFVKTSDSNLDGQVAEIIGFFQTEYAIVRPLHLISGYNPAFVMSIYCLEKV